MQKPKTNKFRLAKKFKRLRKIKKKLVSKMKQKSNNLGSAVRQKKIKQKIAAVVFALGLAFGRRSDADAMGVSPLPYQNDSAHTLTKSDAYSQKQITSAPQVPFRSYKIFYQLPNGGKLLPILELKRKKLHITNELLEELRGGSTSDLLTFAFFITLLIILPPTSDHTFAEAFLQLLNRVRAPQVIQNKYNHPPYSRVDRNHRRQYDGTRQGDGTFCAVPSNQNDQGWSFDGWDYSHTQISTFVNPDGSIDLNQAYQEVLRRTAEYPNFTCSFERFKALSTQCGVISADNAKEAISALQLEAQGHFTNLRRDLACTDINKLGSDFLITGPNGETHLDLKNPTDRRHHTNVLTMHQKARKMGHRICYQIRNWTSDTEGKYSMTPLIHPSKILVGVDLLDIAPDNKTEMQTKVQSRAHECAGKFNIQAPKLLFINNRNR